MAYLEKEATYVLGYICLLDQDESNEAEEFVLSHPISAELAGARRVADWLDQNLDPALEDSEQRIMDISAKIVEIELRAFRIGKKWFENRDKIPDGVPEEM